MGPDPQIEDREGYRVDLHYLRDAGKREVDCLMALEGRPWFAVECRTTDLHASPALRYFALGEKAGRRVDRRPATVSRLRDPVFPRGEDRPGILQQGAGPRRNVLTSCLHWNLLVFEVRLETHPWTFGFLLSYNGVLAFVSLPKPRTWRKGVART